MNVLLATLALVAAAPSGPQNSDDALFKAYQKEFALLKAEKRALTERLTTVESERKKTVAQLEAELARLQRDVVTESLLADREEESLAEIERSRERWEESKERFSAMVDQAKESLAASGIEPDLGSDQESPAALRAIFAAGSAQLDRAKKVRREQGRFYLQDGTEVEGDVLYLGQIATYGRANGVGGALVPAGEGRLKLWHQDAATSAAAMFAGSANGSVKVFLYESLARPIEAKPEKTVLAFIQAGGIIGWIIVGLGIGGILMVLLRVLLLAQAGRGGREVTESVVEAFLTKGRAGALEVAAAAEGATARVLTATLGAIDREREHLEDIVSEAVLKEMPRIERFQSAIAVCAAVAPLLGLLGTVTGMIATFEIITTHGTGDPKMLSHGISEALVTTELGLIVAIPTLLLGSLLAARAATISTDLERAALKLVNRANDPNVDVPEVESVVEGTEDRFGPLNAPEVAPS